MYYNKFAKSKRSGGELLNFVCIYWVIFVFVLCSGYCSRRLAATGHRQAVRIPRARGRSWKKYRSNFIPKVLGDIVVIEGTTARTWIFSVNNSFKSVVVRNTRRYKPCSALRRYIYHEVWIMYVNPKLYIVSYIN